MANMSVKARFGRAAKRLRKRKRLYQEQVRALARRRTRTRALYDAYKANPTANALKLYRRSRELSAKSRAEAMERKGKVAAARKDYFKWEKALRAWRKARRNPHPHLSGDTDCRKELLDKLERLATHLGRNIYLTSGFRSPAEQKVLYDNRASNPYPVAYSDGRNCSSRHCSRKAADCLIGGRPIQHVVPAATLRHYGIEPLLGDAVHVEG